MQPIEKATLQYAQGVIAVRPGKEILSRQRLPYYVGISNATAGAKGISMNLIVIPPAGAAKPHLHKGYETAIYLLKGTVATRYGAELENSIVSREGEFVYIKPDVPHQPINLSATQPAVAIVARNDPNEQESVVHYGEEAERVFLPLSDSCSARCAETTVSSNPTE